MNAIASGRPIRVLHFLNSTSAPGGAEEQACSLFNSLPADQFEVTMVCPPLAYEALFAGRPISSRPVVCLDLHSFSQVSAARKLASVLHSQRIDIAHCHQFRATAIMGPLAAACRVPRVVETTHVREAWRRGWLKKSYAVDRMIYKFVDQFIAVSEANREYLIRQKHCDPPKVTVIHNGRDLSRFRPCPEKAAAVRLRYSVQPDALLIVHVGRLEPQKGHKFLLEAMKPVSERFPSAGLLLVGDGAMRAELEAEVMQRGLRDIVTFAGFQQEVAPFLDAADLVVLPSLWEGLPLIAIEAGAIGKPMVATAVDGTPEVIKDGESGLLVPPADSDSLARAMISLLGDATARQAMGARASEIIKNHFSIERQTRETADLYRRVLMNGASG